MGTRFERLIEALRTGFWFLPLLMLLCSCGLALGLLYLDEKVDPGTKATLAWAYSGGPSGARSLLSTIAGSMITAASVTFSLASVALSIASQQYGSRVLRNFMRDRITQVLLGTFVSTFIYSVLVVRSIRGSDVSGGFVPAISVTVAIGLSLVSLVLLILFIHHVSASIQASHIVEVIGTNMREAIPELYPSQTGGGVQVADADEGFRGQESAVLRLDDAGYLQAVDMEALMRLACECDVVVELLVMPGDHVVYGGALARVWGARELSREMTESMLGTFYFGGERTPEQDIRYLFQQLTDVVVRALSPGINDPFTAINGIDQLASGLVLLARRPRVQRGRLDTSGRMRLLVRAAELSEVLRETVGHIGIYGAGDRFVMHGLRRTLEMVERDARRPEEVTTITRLRVELEEREAAKRREAGLG